MKRTLLLALPLAGCMNMDSFFFPAEPVDEYAYGDNGVPQELVEEVSFVTSDGVTLYGVWLHQQERDAPLLLHFHGNTGNIDHYWDMFGDFWDMGFQLFTFDYRGYGKSEGSPSWSGLMTDGLAAVHHVADRENLLTSQIPYHGLSLGGAVALHTAIERPPSVLMTEDMFASGGSIFSISTTGLELPSGWLLEEPFDNAGSIGLVDAPVMIMHGELDDYIHPDHAWENYHAANDPKYLWLVPGADHAETPQLAPEEYEAHLECWIEDHQACLDQWGTP